MAGTACSGKPRPSRPTPTGGYRPLWCPTRGPGAGGGGRGGGGGGAGGHGREPGGRLDRANKHRAGGALRFANKVHAPVNAVGAMDVSVAGWAKHDRITRRLAAKTVRRRLG